MATLEAWQPAEPCEALARRRQQRAGDVAAMRQSVRTAVSPQPQDRLC